MKNADQRLALIDTHTHIYYAESDEELDALLDRCESSGVVQLLLPNVDQESIPRVLGAAERYPGRCLPMMGLHPCSVNAQYRSALQTIERTLREKTFIAIGEIGLDLYWDTSTFEEQREAFRVQTSWAKELNLPVSIHCRNAYDELVVLLDEIQDGRLRGVLHCFTGNAAQAQRMVDYGLLLGIGGVVTFKNAGLDEVVRQLDPAHLVLETDAPYLAPVPFRGKNNESSYLPYIAKKVADLQHRSLAEIARFTTENAQRVFGLTTNEVHYE